jgi:hypothetical protein
MLTGPGGLGRALIALGLLLVAAGVLLVVADRFPGLRIGRLPGDLSIERPGFRLYVPLATSLLVSIVLSLVLWLWSRRG